MTFQPPDDGAPARSMGRPLPGITAEVVNPSDELVGDIQNRAKHELAAREIEFVEELPKTITGKIRRTELRERTA